MAPDERRESEPKSVTLILDRLRAADPRAAEELWRRYFARLIPLARARLKALPHRATDEEDILLSVFDRFFQAVQTERFPNLNDRDDLWQILLVLTERKVADAYRQAFTQKRGGTLGVHHDIQQMAPQIADPEPGPEFVAAFNDNLERALRRLNDDTTRDVALMRLDGCQNDEIAARLAISLSTVDRKIRVIRELWSEEFGLR